MDMKASFVIGFHTKRFDNLLQTLRFLTYYHFPVIQECQLVTVCQDQVTPVGIWLKNTDLSCMPSEESPVSHFEKYAENFGKWDHYDMNESCMKLPKITNFGIEKADSDKLIILESDRILPSGYFAKVIDQLEDGLQITTENMMKLSQPTPDEDILDHLFDYNEESRSEVNQVGIRNMWSGNTAITKSDFYKAGGMDEEYIGYGWADSDMTNQMESIGVQSVFRQEIELHLWHESATYGDGNQKRMFIRNGLRFLDKWNVEKPQWFKEEIEEWWPNAEDEC